MAQCFCQSFVQLWFRKMFPVIDLNSNQKPRRISSRREKKCCWPWWLWPSQRKVLKKSLTGNNKYEKKSALYQKSKTDTNQRKHSNDKTIYHLEQICKAWDYLKTGCCFKDPIKTWYKRESEMKMESSVMPSIKGKMWEMPKESPSSLFPKYGI